MDRSRQYGLNTTAAPGPRFSQRAAFRKITSTEGARVSERISVGDFRAKGDEMRGDVRPHPTREAPGVRHFPSGARSCDQAGSTLRSFLSLGRRRPGPCALPGPGGGGGRGGRARRLSPNLHLRLGGLRAANNPTPRPSSNQPRPGTGGPRHQTTRDVQRRLQASTGAASCRRSHHGRRQGRRQDCA